MAQNSNIMKKNSKRTLVYLEGKSGAETVQTKYLIDAAGMRPVIRQQLQSNTGFQKVAAAQP